MCDIVNFVEEFQTLFAVIIAGIFTLSAAVIAWFAVMRPARHNTEVQKLATATALWAELAALGARLFADVQNSLYKSELFDPYRPRPLNFAIFNADPLAVGRLPSDAVFMIVNVYKLLLDLNDKFASYNNLGDPGNLRGVELLAEVQKAGAEVGGVLRGFYQTAGIPVEKANAALEHWTSRIEVAAAKTSN